MNGAREIIDAIIKDTQNLTAECLIVQKELKKLTDQDGLQNKDSNGNFILPVECVYLVEVWAEFLDKIDLGIKAVRGLCKKSHLKPPPVFKDIQRLHKKERRFIERICAHHLPTNIPSIPT